MGQEEVYEKYQNLNYITRFLHSYRYKWILSVFEELSRKKTDSPIKVVDIGCGTCNLFKLLKDNSYLIDYIGIEPNEDFANCAIKRYGHNNNFKIIKGFAQEVIPQIDSNVDIFTALESLEHIPEFIVPQILLNISKKNPSIFACSVPVEVGPAIWIKNIGSKLMGYFRYKEYTWEETFWAGLYQLDKLPPHGTGHKGFDWRWLKHNIRQSMNITSINKSPFTIIPSSFAPSICFTSVPLVKNKVNS